MRPQAVTHTRARYHCGGPDVSRFDPDGRACLSMAGFHALLRCVRMIADKVCAGGSAHSRAGFSRVGQPWFSRWSDLFVLRVLMRGVAVLCARRRYSVPNLRVCS